MDSPQVERIIKDFAKIDKNKVGESELQEFCYHVAKIS